MKTLIALTILALLAWAVITRPDTKDKILVRRSIVDPNGTITVIYQREFEAAIRKDNGPEIRLVVDRLILQMTLDDGCRDVNPAGVILEAIDELETAIAKENEK